MHCHYPIIITRIPLTLACIISCLIQCDIIRVHAIEYAWRPSCRTIEHSYKGKVEKLNALVYFYLGFVDIQILFHVSGDASRVGP